MRVVLDTGILIAALITADTPPDQVYQAWRKKRFTLISSVWQLGEFRRVSRYERVKKVLNPAEAGNLINGLRHHATVLTELPEVICPVTRKTTRCSPWPSPVRPITSLPATGADYCRSSGSAPRAS